MTRTGLLLKRLKNNKYVAILIVVGAVVSGIIGFGEKLQKFATLIYPKKETVTLAQITELLNKSQPPKRVSYEALPKKLQERFDRTLRDLTQSRFYFSAGAETYRADNPAVLKYLVSVTKDMRYALVALGNASVLGLRASCFDEQNNLVDSESGDREVVLKQSADYSGTLRFYIEVMDVDAVGQINVAVGRRGPTSGHGFESESLGVEPAFEMDSPPPP